ncbi:MAG TPA: HIT domain-containing protein [Candidatus Kapabacteria bacterium]|nr:HIT domain-containing protein [Candidatus Kapabacteria bacterium]HPO64058.1 HIT domain-containing protein [Candidatus Kapabacteria bacterium]
MEILWSPWRSQYIDTFKEEKNSQKAGCFICEAINAVELEKERLVVARFEFCIVMLNKFPYNNGHILIAPKKHTGDMDKLPDEEAFEILQTTRKATKILTKVFNPNGFNIGMNLGRVAGAGLPDHLHVHIVPRWNGDSNFMPVIADVKVVSQSLEQTQEILANEFNTF